MAGNRNSGRRRSVETLLRDAGMSTRLASDALRRAAVEHQAEGRAIVAAFAALRDLDGDIDRVVAEIQRHTDPTPPAGVISIDRRRGERRATPAPAPRAVAA